jgi:hypothetical protein
MAGACGLSAGAVTSLPIAENITPRTAGSVALRIEFTMHAESPNKYQ